MLADPGVRVHKGVPPVSMFSNRSGTPIVIDLLTGKLYYLSEDNVVTPVATGGGGGGSVDSVSGAPGEINVGGTPTDPVIGLSPTGVVPGIYSPLAAEVDEFGRIVEAANAPPPPPAGVQSVSGSPGRISSSGGDDPIIDLVATGITPGTYPGATLTVDAYGRITAIVAGAAAMVSFVLGADPYIEVVAAALPFIPNDWALVVYI